MACGSSDSKREGTCCRKARACTESSERKKGGQTAAAQPRPVGHVGDFLHGRVQRARADFRRPIEPLSDPPAETRRHKPPGISRSRAQQQPDYAVASHQQHSLLCAAESREGGQRAAVLRRASPAGRTAAQLFRYAGNATRNLAAQNNTPRWGGQQAARVRPCARDSRSQIVFPAHRRRGGGAGAVAES